MKRIRLVHIVNYDKKFFNSVMRHFEEDERFENFPIIVVQNEKDRSEIGEIGHNATIMTGSNSLKQNLQSEDYDAVFFHSLPYRFWPIITYIPRDKKIIWWAWGFDLYASWGFCRPFIPVKEYKDETLKLYENRINPAKRIAVRIRDYAESLRYVRMRDRVISRIDYFQPVISLEYELMKKYNPLFHAQEFYYPKSFWAGTPINNEKNIDGNVLLGNSATYTNNHLDVWRNINGKVCERQNVIVPINYGIQTYADELAVRINGNNVWLLRDMLPSEEYFKILGDCSYMIMGVMRQQAMGNISWAICNGIKVFLFKGSIVYQYLKKMGITVYSIEDIDDKSFTMALPLDAANKNILLYKNESERRKNVLEGFLRSMRININNQE